MLIRDLQLIKERLVFQRLYLADAHESTGSWLSKRLLLSQLSDTAMVESKVVILQHRLSFICSLMCACASEWDIIEYRKIYQPAIRKLLDSINRRDISSLNLFTKINEHKYAELFRVSVFADELNARRATLENYVGFKINSNPIKISIKDLQNVLSTVIGADLSNEKSLLKAIKLIGRNEAIDFKNEGRYQMLKGREN